MFKNIDILRSTICEKLLTSASRALGCQSTPEVCFLHLLSLLLVQEQDMDYYAGQLGQREWSKNHSRTRRTHLQAGS